MYFYGRFVKIDTTTIDKSYCIPWIYRDLWRTFWNYDLRNARLKHIVVG